MCFQNRLGERTNYKDQFIRNTWTNAHLSSQKFRHMSKTSVYLHVNVSEHLVSSRSVGNRNTMLIKRSECYG